PTPTPSPSVQPRGETGTAAAPEPRLLHLVDDALVAHLQQRLGVVPSATGPRSGEAPILEPVEIGEDAILVREHRVPSGPMRRQSSALKNSLSAVGQPSGQEA